VRACRGKYDVVNRPTEERFVEDLREAIRRWYEDHEGDVRALGGRTLESALQAITVDRAGRVPSVEVAAFGYDPARYDVFYHPDPVFPGSDRVWYGTYDGTGRLLAIDPVN